MVCYYLAMNDVDLMKEALAEARKALEMGEVPVGAVVALNGEIVARGHNEREAKLSIASHAEIEALHSAEKKLGRVRLFDCTVYVTLEPCLMCAGAILQSRIHRLVYALDDPKAGAVRSRFHVFDEVTDDGVPLVEVGCKKEESKALLQTFFANRRR